MKPSAFSNILHRPQLMTAAAARYLIDEFCPSGRDSKSQPSGPFSFLKQAFVRGEETDPGHRVEAPVARVPGWVGKPDSCGAYGSFVKDGVAVITIDSVLFDEGFAYERFDGQVVFFHGYDTIQNSLELADADPSVKSIMLRLDSPGGMVASGIYDLAAFMRERRSQPDAKPLWAVCETACSAAYWIAAQADHIVAPQPAFIGSIGVVILHYDVSDMLARHGLKITPVQFGADKTSTAEFRRSSKAQGVTQLILI